MSAKTKIVVLHMKEVIYTGIFIVLGILFIILLIMMFLPKDETTDTAQKPSVTHEDTPSSDIQQTTSDSLYIPGVYTTELILGGQTVDVEVIVSQQEISSIRLVNPNEAVTTMYPLLAPTLEHLCQQVYETQSLSGIKYDTESKYTSLVLLQAIQNSLDKALLENQASKMDEID